MKRRIISIVSLLLAFVMLFTSCSDKKKVEPREDNPVTAESVLNNFLSFKKGEDVKRMNNAQHLNETLGETYNNNDEYIIFHKETKDRLNNLTDTYSVYSIKNKAVAFTITNTYADEWGWEDDFGNETYPEKLIEKVKIETYDDITYFVVKWTAYTKIEDEIVEEEELEWSYVETCYCEFYDIEGNLLSTSHTEESGRVVSENDYYTVIDLGKTIAVFDNETGKVVSKYDGDVSSTPKLYDYSNEYYDYMLQVPVSGISPAVNPTLYMFRTAIRVYDKEGDLILDYAHGDIAGMITRNIEVLEGGDILIQNIYAATTVDYDYVMDGRKVNVDTYILDVETGKITMLLKDNDGYEFTDNVRNIMVTSDFETDTIVTVFFDNFGNVNYVFDGKLAYEKDDAADVRAEQCTVLADNRLLVTRASGVADRAIIDNSGNVVAYLTPECLVLDDCIVIIKPNFEVEVYNFDMSFVRSVYYSALSSYQGENDSITFKGTVGNSLLFSVVDAWYTYDVDGMPVLNETHLTVIIDIEISSINTYTDNILVDFGAEKPEKFAVMFEFIEDSKNRIYTVINENAKVVLTVIGYDVEIIYSDESIALLKFMTEDGEQCYLVDNTNSYDYEDTPPEYKPEDEYNPEDKDEGDEDDEGDDGDDDGKDDGGDEYNPDEGDDEDEGGKY